LFYYKVLNFYGFFASVVGSLKEKEEVPFNFVALFNYLGIQVLDGRTIQPIQVHDC